MEASRLEGDATRGARRESTVAARGNARGTEKARCCFGGRPRGAVDALPAHVGG